VQNLAVSRENNLAAESRIMDADVASEAAELTRLNILQQSGVAVLAQANQSPQLAIQLLR
jgi:flagellin